MIVYLGGDCGGGTRPEETVIRLKANRLYSYYYHGDGKPFNVEYVLRIKTIKQEKESNR